MWMCLYPTVPSDYPTEDNLFAEELMAQNLQNKIN